MKFRTDFVTNSSSSSFVLVLRITLKNGKVLKYSEEGEPECGICPSIVATASPEKLGRSGSVEGRSARSRLRSFRKATMKTEPFWTITTRSSNS